MTTNLIELSCRTYTENETPLSKEETSEYNEQVPEWKIDAGQLSKEFERLDFKEALTFVNQVGELANKEDHHPDILIHDYNKILIMLTTHAVGGLTLNDFILAAKIEKLH